VRRLKACRYFPTGLELTPAVVGQEQIQLETLSRGVRSIRIEADAARADVQGLAPVAVGLPGAAPQHRRAEAGELAAIGLGHAASLPPAAIVKLLQEDPR